MGAIGLPELLIVGVVGLVVVGVPVAVLLLVLLAKSRKRTR